MEDCARREKQWASEQLEAVLAWLGARDTEQEDKLGWLLSHSYPGTSGWIVRCGKIRSWLQRGTNNQILWLHGKPGSGKHC